MNRIHFYFLASAIALGGFAASGEESASRDSETPSPERAVRERRISVPQFEYLVEKVHPQDSVQHVLNKLGLEGWELVSVARYDRPGPTTLYLKRTSRSPQTQTKNEGEQAGSGQFATRPESKPEGSDKPQPESEGRSR
jgi:hypothetical protein